MFNNASKIIEQNKVNKTVRVTLLDWKFKL